MELPLDIFSVIITHLDHPNLVNFLHTAKVFYQTTSPLLLEAVHSVFVKLMKTTTLSEIMLPDVPYPEIGIGFRYELYNSIYRISYIYDNFEKIDKFWNHIFVRFEFKSIPKINQPKIQINNVEMKLYQGASNYTYMELPIEQLTILHFIHSSFIKIPPTIEMYRNCLTLDKLRIIAGKLKTYTYDENIKILENGSFI